MDKYVLMQLLHDLEVLQIAANDLENKVIRLAVKNKLSDTQTWLTAYANKLKDK